MLDIWGLARLTGSFLLFFFLTCSAVSQTSWELAKEKNGIRIYTKAVEGSETKVFRAVTEMETSIEEVFRILRNVRKFPEWVPYTASAKRVKTEENVLIVYIFSDLPWPVSDRDGYYEYTFQYNEGANYGYVQIRALPDFAEEKEHAIRIQETKGFWKFSKLSGGKLKVTYQLHTEYEGSIPSWLAKSSVVSTPYRTLMGLNEQVAAYHQD